MGMLHYPGRATGQKTSVHFDSRSGSDLLPPPRAQIVAGAGGWSVLIPGVPLAADGATLAAAVDEMIDVLREYAEDWQDRLRDAPEHAGNRGLVRLVELSTDGELRDWLVGPGLRP